MYFFAVSRWMPSSRAIPRIDNPLIHVNHFVRLLPHQKMLPKILRLLIDAHRPEVNRSHLTIGPTAFG